SDLRISENGRQGRGAGRRRRVRRAVAIGELRTFRRGGAGRRCSTGPQRRRRHRARRSARRRGAGDCSATGRNRPRCRAHLERRRAGVPVGWPGADTRPLPLSGRRGRRAAGETLLRNRAAIVKVLVYQIGQLGDTIVSIPALRAVRHHFGPNTLLYMLHDVTHRLVTAEMVLEGSGLVDEFIPYSPEKTLRKTPLTAARLWRRLRREHFDAAVSLLPSDRPRWSLWRDRMFFRACGISRLVGFHAFPESDIRPRDLAGRPARTPSEAALRLRRIFSDGIDIASQDFLASPLLSVSRDRQAMVDAWLE